MAKVDPLFDMMGLVGELHAVEWSPEQKKIHIQRLGQAVMSNFALFSRPLPDAKDRAWVLVGIAPSIARAQAIADTFRTLLGVDDE